MSSAQTAWGTEINAEASAAWDGPLFERFSQFREVVTTGLGAHGTEAMQLFPPQPGERVLDLGCGFGDTTQQLAALAGTGGEAVGVDVSARFIEASREDAAAAGVANVSFEVADVQTVAFPPQPFDMAFSRMGTMFFASPVAALRNVAGALKPGGRLVMVVWRARTDNAWLHRAQQIVEGIVSRPEEYEEPTCGPGPFSMANADTVSDILIHAGYGEISLRRCDLPILVGRDMDEALAMIMAIGPAGEILRLLGDRALDKHAEIREALVEGLSDYEREDGSVWGPASTWIVSARTPA